MNKTNSRKHTSSVLSQKGDDFPKLARPALRALAAAGAQNLKQLTKFSEQEVKQWHGIGPNALIQLRQALADRGFSFANERNQGVRKMKKRESTVTMTASQHIDKYVKELTDWRGEFIVRLRKLIREAAPELAEEWKWDTPVWSHKGNVVAAGVFKDHVKLNFFKGALLDDPKHLFNAGLDAKATRAIDFSEGDLIDEPALKDLVRAAVTQNTTGSKKK